MDRESTSTVGQSSAKQLDVGDTVRILNERTGHPSGFVGVITDIDEVAAVVGVDFPFTEGSELHYRAELIVPAEGGYSEHVERSDIQERYENVIHERVASKHLDLVEDRLVKPATKLRSEGRSEVQTYKRLAEIRGRGFSDHQIRDAVKLAYGHPPQTPITERVARDLSKLSVRHDIPEQPIRDLLEEF